MISKLAVNWGHKLRLVFIVNWQELRPNLIGIEIKINRNSVRGKWQELISELNARQKLRPNLTGIEIEIELKAGIEPESEMN